MSTSSSSITRQKEIFLAALQVSDADERERFLKQACGDDEAGRPVVAIEVLAADRHRVEDRDRVVEVDEHVDARQPLVRGGSADQRI